MLYHTQTLKILCFVKEDRPKGHILCDSIYIKCPEQAVAQRQKADQQLLGDQGKGKKEVTAYR